MESKAEVPLQHQQGEEGEGGNHTGTAMAGGQGGTAGVAGHAGRRHRRRAKKRKAPRNPDNAQNSDQPLPKQPNKTQPLAPPPPPAPKSSSQQSALSATQGQKNQGQNKQGQQQQQQQNSPTKKANKKKRCRKRRSGAGGGGEGRNNGGPNGQGGHNSRVGLPHNNLVLRPTRGPPAPQNSTQYIIEDHVCDDSDSNPDPDAIDDENGGDDDRVWDEFSERDFQNVYENAHREEVSEWDRDKLIREIKGMEKKRKDLLGLIQRMDPDVYLEHLMTRATTVLEKNRLLKLQQQMGLDSLKHMGKSIGNQGCHNPQSTPTPDGATSPGTLTVTSTASINDDEVASTSCNAGGGGGNTDGNLSPPVQA